MNNPDTDEIVNYLSTRFNKIFCDRDFVCCVADDFQSILNNKNKCCVLVFPVLGPIYQKAVRYQAKIFDLAVFGLSSGKNKSVAVCQRQYLVKKPVDVKEEVMADACSVNLRRKRPERQLYVPPAQRSSRVVKEESPPKNNLKKCEVKVQIHSDRNAHRKNKIDDRPIVDIQNIIPLKDFLDLQCTKLCWRYDIASDNYSDNLYLEHNNCTFYRYILFGEKDQITWTIPIYYLDFCKNFFYVLSYNTVLWQPKLEVTNLNNNTCANCIAYPFFDFNLHYDDCQEHIAISRSSIWQSEYGTKSLNSIENVDECNVYKVLCPEIVKSDEIIDLSVFKLPHCFLIKDASDLEYCFLCEEDHSIETCYLNRKSELPEIIKESPEVEKQEIINGTKNNSFLETNVLEISKVKTTDMIRNSINSSKEKNSPEKRISKSPDKKLSKKQEHDQEKEIMRKTKENINRKSKPIMKYVDDNNDTLKIDKTDNVNNWEDLFDDEGQLQDELFTEIVQKVGNDVTIVKATEDYSAYTAKPIEELEHVVELYNFPSTLETHDIIQIFSDINSDAMYIKWVDDTHALLVLGSLSQAQKAVELDNPLIKARPMSAASGPSLAVAYKSDLKPAMKRPQTNLQTARRLITSHLGAKTRVSKEQSAKEREDLKVAREMKRQAKQNEKDAWEGFCRSSN